MVISNSVKKQQLNKLDLVFIWGLKKNIFTIRKDKESKGLPDSECAK